MSNIIYIAVGIGLYELLRENIARSVRLNIPEVFSRELANRNEFIGLAGPLLGTPAVSEAVGAVAEQTVLDNLPTLFGRRRYEPLARRA